MGWNDPYKWPKINGQEFIYNRSFFTNSNSRKIPSNSPNCKGFDLCPNPKQISPCDMKWVGVFSGLCNNSFAGTQQLWGYSNQTIFLLGCFSLPKTPRVESLIWKPMLFRSGWYSWWTKITDRNHFMKCLPSQLHHIFSIVAITGPRVWSFWRRYEKKLLLLSWWFILLMEEYPAPGMYKAL